MGRPDQLSSWDSSEQQRRPQGALSASRCATVESLPYAALAKNHEFAIAACENGESLI